MKRILVTGANGQLGKSIQKIQSTYPQLSFLFAPSQELDITNEEQVNTFFRENPIDVCVNCAAYTAVDKAESEMDKAQTVNVDGAKNLARSCKKHDATLVQISTDFVFDGNNETVYSEEDSTNPLGVYAMTKRDAEKTIIQNTNHYYILRTSWLYSEFGNNFMKTMLRLGKQIDTLTVVSDQIGSPTYAEDLAHVIVQFVLKEPAFGIYHYSNNGNISWYDFAKGIFENAELTTNVDPIPTSSYPTPAKRPLYSVLDTSKIEKALQIKIPHWESSLKKAIKNLQMKESLETAIEASLKAGAAIMKIYEREFDISIKDDRSPLTEADTASNNVINSFLEETVFPIISEENKQLEYDQRKDWKTCWIVDPLDGTKEFIKRNGEFTVNIALITDGKPEMGVIYVPAQKTLYYAVVKEGKAYKAALENHETSIEEIYKVAEAIQPEEESDTIKVVGSRSHMNQETQDFIETLKGENKKIEIVSKGSSLKFCLVAEGNATVYPRYAPTMEWDTAAGQAICSAVGIKVISLETDKTLGYNRENLLNPWFICRK